MNRNSLNLNKATANHDENEFNLVKEFLEYKRFKIMLKKAISEEL